MGSHGWHCLGPQEQLGGSHKGSVTTSALQAASTHRRQSNGTGWGWAWSPPSSPELCPPGRHGAGSVTRGCGCQHWLWEMSPHGVPGHVCPSVSPRLSISGVGLLLQPRHLQERVEVGTEPCWGLPSSWRLPGGTQAGGEEGRTPLPCQAAEIHGRQRLLGFPVLSPAAGAQKMGIRLLWGKLKVSGQTSTRHHVTSQAQRENPAGSACPKDWP